MTAAALRRLRSITPDQLVEQHIPLVRRLAWHVHGRWSSAVEPEELMQAGLLALVEAAQGYEDRGYEFATYASIRIRGAMVDALRRESRQSRDAAAKRRELEAARGRVEGRTGHAATSDEMAREMGLSAAAYRAAEAASATMTQLSIEDVYSDQNAAFASDEAGPEEWLDDARTRHMLAAAIGTLPEREQLVLQLYFHEELNLEEIGQVLNVSAARVCQVKAGALKSLKAKLALPA